MDKRKLIRIEERPIPEGVARLWPKGYKSKIYWLECQNPFCKKIFPIRAKRYRQGVGIFCSTKCRGQKWKGKDNPRWRGGVSQLRKQILSSDRNKFLESVKEKQCYHCGFGKYKECLEVHHLIPFKETSTESQIKANHSFDKLVILCANCHRYIHKTGKLPDLSLFG